MFPWRNTQHSAAKWKISSLGPQLTCGTHGHRVYGGQELSRTQNKAQTFLRERGMARVKVTQAYWKGPEPALVGGNFPQGRVSHPHLSGTFVQSSWRQPPFEKFLGEVALWPRSSPSSNVAGLARESTRLGGVVPSLGKPGQDVLE